MEELMSQQGYDTFFANYELRFKKLITFNTMWRRKLTLREHTKICTGNWFVWEFKIRMT